MSIPYFSSLFTQERKSIVEYNGKTIHKFFKYNHLGKKKVKFRFVSSNSDNEQCIVLSFSQSKNFKLYWNNNEFIPPKRAFPSLDLFEKTYGKEFELTIDLQEGTLGIFNGSVKNGFVTYCSLGSAMIIEELGNDKFRFHCNDFENDDDFDDLIFEIEILKEDN